MIKRLVLRAALVLLLAVPAVRAQTVPVDDYDRIYEEARYAMWWGDFEALERMHTLYQLPGRRVASNGRPTLRALYRGLSSSVGSTVRAKNGYFQHVDDLTLQWAREHPNSSFAHVLHASALRRHGYSYRGGGYANQVPAEAMRDFQRYVGMAIKYLLDHQSAAMQTSAGYVELLELGKLAGWGIPQLWGVATQGLAAFPRDEDVMRAMVGAVVPKWGGDPVVVDRTIKELVKTTGAADGDIYYAKLYAWAADEQFGPALFQESGADWGRMKAGLREFVERYPAAMNLNEFAYFACLARDKTTLRELLERVGPKPRLDSWRTNGSRTFEGCKRWASEV